MSMDSIIEVFYHLNKMSIASKHIADNNFCLSGRQRTGPYIVCNIVQTSQLHFLWHMTPTAQMWLVNPTDYTI